MSLQTKVIELLKEKTAELEAGTSSLSESEALDLVGVLCHQELNMTKACKYLNISRSKFNRYIKENKLPKGKKEAGSTALIWYKDELEKYKSKI